MQVEDEENQTKEALDGRALTKCFIRPTPAAGRSDSSQPLTAAHDSPGSIYRHNAIGLLQIGLLVSLDHELVNDHEIGLGYPIKRLQAEIRL